MIVAYQPRCNYDIAFLEPVIADGDVRDMPGPSSTVNIALISIIEIMIARYKKELRKVLTETLQGQQTEVEGLQINRGSMMMPVPQEQASVAIVCFGSLDNPIHKGQTVLVVNQAVGFQSKMYVSERDRSLEKIGHRASLRVRNSSVNVLWTIGIAVLASPARVKPVQFQDVVAYVLVFLFDVEYARERVSDGSSVISKRVLAL